MGSSLRIIFMGTPEIAAGSLKELLRSGYKPQAVITVPDKPAGRGLKVHQSPVKQYAIDHQIPVMQPEDLNDAGFHEQLRALKPDLIIVVAFRKLPSAIIDIPAKGSFNLHASILPQYRGAAPINWTIINGETETGVTTFFLDNKIDTGKILFTEKVDIAENQTASELHDVLMEAGAQLVVKTVKAIEHGNYSVTDQSTLTETQTALRKAPKLKKEDCRIDWHKDVKDIYDFIRGLSLHPGAFTELISPNNDRHYIKLFATKYMKSDSPVAAGSLDTDGFSYLRISGADGFIYLKEVQLAGKKMMNIEELLRGFKISNDWKI
jgi:methionyl-tRNA formyltransferase